MAAERTLSEFLQHSGRLMPDVEVGEVLLHRRDGEDLVLMTRRQNEALHTTARAFFALANGGASGVDSVLPWIVFLSRSDRESCLRELSEVGAAALESGRLSHLAEALYAWESTALASWDEQRDRERRGGAEEGAIDVPRPCR